MRPLPDEGGPTPLTVTAFRFCPACAAELPGPQPVTCPGCGRRHWRNAKPCAGALVTRADGALLLVQRSFAPFEGWWDIPGGFCDPDEHPADAAVREVREETGLAVRVTGLLGMWMDRYEQGAQVQSTLNIYFHAEPTGELTIRLDPAEATAAEWFGAGDLPSEVAFPDHTDSVLRAWREAVEAGRAPDAGTDRSD